MSVVTHLVGGVTQAFHDGRVVELKEQLGVQEVEGKEDRQEQVEVERERRLKEGHSWMTMEMSIDKTQILSQMRCETTPPGVQECALCARSAYHVHHASVCVNVVIGVLVVLCELHVIVRVHVIPLCGAVVGLTLGLIAHVVIVVFVVAIFQKILLYLEVYSLHLPSVTVNCCWLSPNINVILHQINFENHSTNNWPNHCLAGFPDQSVLGPSSR